MAVGASCGSGGAATVGGGGGGGAAGASKSLFLSAVLARVHIQHRPCFTLRARRTLQAAVARAPSGLRTSDCQEHAWPADNYQNSFDGGTATAGRQNSARR